MEPITENSTAPTLRARFNATFLRWVSPAVAKSDIRYYLEGYCITPHESGKGCWIVATNGHMMLIAWDAEGYASEQMVIRVSPAGIRTITKRHEWGRETHATVAQVEGDRLTLLNRSGEEIFVQPGKCHIERATYPDWRRVAPPNDRAKLVPGAHATIRSDYLASAVSQLPKPTSAAYSPLRLWQAKTEIESQRADRAVFMEIFDLPILGIIMPFRSDWMPNGPHCSFTKFAPQAKQQCEQSPAP